MHHLSSLTYILSSQLDSDEIHFLDSSSESLQGTGPKSWPPGSCLLSPLIGYEEPGTLEPPQPLPFLSRPKAIHTNNEVVQNLFGVHEGSLLPEETTGRHDHRPTAADHSCTDLVPQVAGYSTVYSYRGVAAPQHLPLIRNMGRKHSQGQCQKGRGLGKLQGCSGPAAKSYCA